MAQVSWPDPAEGREIDEIDYEALEGLAGDNGLVGDPTVTAPVTATGAAMEVVVRSGLTGRVQGFGWSSGTTDVPLAIAANASGSTRLDRVVLRLDRSTWQVQAVILQGTPGAGAPAVTQQTGSIGVWEELLATVTVVDGAAVINAGDVISRPRWIGPRMSLANDGLTTITPAVGEQTWVHDVQKLLLWGGTEWKTLYEETGSVSAGIVLAGWTATVDTLFRRRSGLVILRAGTWQWTGASIGSGVATRLPITIPTLYQPAVNSVYGAMSVYGAHTAARATIYHSTDAKAGQVWLNNHAGIPTGAYVLGTNVTWAVG
jgi:hypothetical protein